jgi:hypothetical protein
MRTLLVTGGTPAPAELREILVRGSTSLDEVKPRDLSTYVSPEGFGVDRLVFFAGSGDRDVRELALTYATAAGRERQQTIVYVTAGPEDPLDGMTRDEVFVWPRDEDKLKMAFMTGG